MGKINVASYALAVGAIGQALLLGHLPDRIPHWLVFVPLLGPWLIGHVISFCRVAPCGPRRFAQILTFAMVWYSLDAFVCELSWLLVPASRSQMYSAVIPHVLCWGSALSFIVLMRGSMKPVNPRLSSRSPKRQIPSCASIAHERDGFQTLRLPQPHPTSRWFPVAENPDSAAVGESQTLRERELRFALTMRMVCCHKRSQT